MPDVRRIGFTQLSNDAGNNTHRVKYVKSLQSIL